MRVAALDLGTNTFLCLIAEGRSGLENILSDDVEVVRLGQDLIKTGRFHPEALERARSCLRRYKNRIDRSQVDQVVGVATAAARDAENGPELFKIADEIGIPIRVISGKEEARLSYLGACYDKAPDQTRLVIDIGGGSTELIVGRGSDVLYSESLPMGAVRFTEAFVSSQPVSAAERSSLDLEIKKCLSEALPEIEKHRVEELVAVAGTPTSLAALELGGFDAERVHGFSLGLSRLDHWCDEFARTTVEEKKSKYGLGGRADIIYAGASILSRIAKALKKDSIQVSTKGLRYGVALDALSRS